MARAEHLNRRRTASRAVVPDDELLVLARRRAEAARAQFRLERLARRDFETRLFVLSETLRQPEREQLLDEAAARRRRDARRLHARRAGRAARSRAHGSASRRRQLG